MPPAFVKAKAAVKGQTLPPSDMPLQTDLASLTGSFIATNGVITNKDLLAMSPLLRINGTGHASLPAKTIDYNLNVSIVETSKGQQGKELAKLKGLTIPIKITGPFNQLKPTVDLASVLKNQASEEIKARVAEKLKDKVHGPLGELLGSELGLETPQTETTDAPTESQPQKSIEEQAKDALKNKLKSFF